MTKTGRPTKYKPEYADELVKFFSASKKTQYIKKEKTVRKSNGTEEVEREYGWMAEDLPTFAKFARQLKVNGDTIVEWAKVHPEFSAAYNEAKDLQKEFLVDNGLQGLYPPASFIFTAKNITDMKDRQEVTGKDGKDLFPVPILTHMNVPSDHSDKEDQPAPKAD